MFHRKVRVKMWLRHHKHLIIFFNFTLPLDVTLSTLTLLFTLGYPTPSILNSDVKFAITGVLTTKKQLISTKLPVCWPRWVCIKRLDWQSRWNMNIWFILLWIFFSRRGINFTLRKNLPVCVMDAHGRPTLRPFDPPCDVIKCRSRGKALLDVERCLEQPQILWLNFYGSIFAVFAVFATCLVRAP